MDLSFDIGLFFFFFLNSRRSGAGWEGTHVIKTRCLWRLPYVTDSDREAPASLATGGKKEERSEQ